MKFNGFENYFITQAIKDAVIKAELEIKQSKELGKNSLFAEGYFEMISKDMLTKLDENTLVSYIKERNKKK